MSGAWSQLVGWDGSDEFLELCSAALLEVQAEAGRRLARRQRAYLENAPETGTLELIAVIDPEEI
jgi:hypothetical protein